MRANGVDQAVGTDRLASLGCDCDRLCDRAWDNFASTGRAWLRAMFEDHDGVDPMLADEIAALRISAMQRQLQGLADAAFERPVHPGRNGLVVPASLAIDAVAPINQEAMA